jgi:hypothetical protein
MEVRISKVVSQILSDHLPAYGLNEIVAEFVEEEVQGKLTQVLESISKKHQIPLDILLHDVPGLKDDQRCRGVQDDEGRESGQMFVQGFAKRVLQVSRTSGRQHRIKAFEQRRCKWTQPRTGTDERRGVSSV